MQQSSIPKDQAAFYATFAETIFFGATVGLLIWGVFGEVDATNLQRNQMKQDAYARLRDHHHDLIRLQIEQPKTLEVFDRNGIKDKVGKAGGVKPRYDNDKRVALSEKEKQIQSLYMAEFDLYERVWAAVEDPDVPSVNEIEWIGMKSNDKENKKKMDDWSDNIKKTYDETPPEPVDITRT